MVILTEQVVEQAKASLKKQNKPQRNSPYRRKIRVRKVENGKNGKNTFERTVLENGRGRIVQ